MMFYRVNDHTTSCVISEQEIKDMGYQLQALYQDKNLASRFMKEICQKADQVGFHISERMQTVQTAMFPNHQLVLNFIDINPEQDINVSIESLLSAADAVDLLGRDRLEEIYDMTGDEKIEAFQDCMKELSKEAQRVLEDNMKDELIEVAEEEHQELTENAVQRDVTDAAQEKQLQRLEAARNANYLLQFSNLQQVENFCKHATAQVPGKLYKDRDNYFMSVDLSVLERSAIGGFIFQADEYANNITKDNMFITYLEEHGEQIIGENPMKVLLNM